MNKDFGAALRTPLRDAFDGRSVLVTGHTGFKGSWLSIWLNQLGARVVGYSLEPPTTPSNFLESRLAQHLTDVRGDVRDLARLCETIVAHRPTVVFHLAAQPLVLLSYQQPKETFDVNVSGMVNVLEAVRTTASVRAVVCITTDKVYENQEWLWGYREIDELGGHDPYSASKAMAELAAAAYRRSFFPVERYAEHGVALATARAGNVFGGGDWGEHRLVPDCVRALTSGRPIQLRNPGFVRPWQILLEPLSGYLWLAAKLLSKEGIRFAEAWNLGPADRQQITAEQVVQKAIQLWGTGSYSTGTTQQEVETEVLRLDSDKATHRLGWHPICDWEEALGETIGWYRAHQESYERGGTVDMHQVCVDQIARYTQRAAVAGLPWATGTGDG